MLYQPLLPIIRNASLRLKVLAAIIAVNAVLGIVVSDYAFAGPPDPPEYEVTVIPGPDCGIFGYGPANGWGINDLGNICGEERNCASDREPFFWSPETGRIVINAPPSILQGRALDLNNSNAVVGWYDNGQPDAGRFGFVYQDGQFTTLPIIPESVFSEAQAINDAGDVAGFWIDHLDTGFLFALLWRADQIISLQLPFGPSSAANDINQSGQITGWMGDAFFIDAHAFIWDNGKVTDLGVIPGGFTAEGIAINNQGDVAVEGFTFNDNKEVIIRSFLWRDGEWIDIGVLPGCEITRVLDINDAGQLIGQCEGPGIVARFLWEDGVIWDVNELWISEDPDFNGIGGVRAASNTGSIAGGGSHNEFGGVALRLSPIIPRIGDLDGDGDVDVADLLALLSAWGVCDDCNNCPADLDGNCSVATSDLLILLSNWG